MVSETFTVNFTYIFPNGDKKCIAYFWYFTLIRNKNIVTFFPTEKGKWTVGISCHILNRVEKISTTEFRYLLLVFTKYCSADFRYAI